MKLNGEQKEYLKGKDHSFVVIDGLEYFLSSSSNEFCNLVIDFYYKLTPEVVYNTFLKIEQEENIRISNKDYNIKLYRENYELIGNLLEERGFINKVKGR